ncbi:MAG: helix-hairpin-helix domain-containing protein [Lentisphaerae bacterium]|nr:helix-hairpin-helix domain-containing protein [Lentisphaerota bacterium]
MQLDDEKQRQAEQVARWISTIRNSKTLPQTDDRLLESPDWWKPEFVDPEVEAAITGFRRSKQVLEALGDESDGDASANSFVLPLGIILDALPPRYVHSEVPANERRRPIRVFLDDLFEQLARGSVRVTIARLVFGVPVGLISSMALRDTDTKVELPLKDVVDAVGSQVLTEHTAKPGRRFDTAYLPELFVTTEARPSPAPAAEPEAARPELPAAVAPQVDVVTPIKAVVEPVAAPVLDAAPARSEPSAIAAVPPLVAVELPVEAPRAAAVVDAPPVDVPAAVVVSPAAVSVAPRHEPAAPEVPAATAAEVFVSSLAWERLNSNGVDLNRATAEDLMTLKGVTPMVASAILEHREKHGLFTDVFALADVPRVGRKTFRKITGMAYSRTGRHRRDVLAKWLGLAPTAASSLPALVRAVAARPGLRGCVMSDRDGLLLAESGVGEQAALYSAIVPRLLTQIRENIREIGGEGINSVTISYDGQLITVVAGGDTYLTVIHAANRLTTALHHFLRRMALELEWWFSRRGYVVHVEAAPGAP